MPALLKSPSRELQWFIKNSVVVWLKIIYNDSSHNLELFIRPIYVHVPVAGEGWGGSL